MSLLVAGGGSRIDGAYLMNMAAAIDIALFGKSIKRTSSWQIGWYRKMFVGYIVGYIEHDIV